MPEPTASLWCYQPGRVIPQVRKVDSERVELILWLPTGGSEGKCFRHTVGLWQLPHFLSDLWAEPQRVIETHFRGHQGQRYSGPKTTPPKPKLNLTLEDLDL